jgi:hypothetical protein
MNTKNLVQTVVGLTLSVVALSVMVYYGGRAWKKSQSGEKLI